MEPHIWFGIDLLQRFLKNPTQGFVSLPGLKLDLLEFIGLGKHVNHCTIFSFTIKHLLQLLGGATYFWYSLSIFVVYHWNNYNNALKLKFTSKIKQTYKITRHDQTNMKKKKREMLLKYI